MLKPLKDVDIVCVLPEKFWAALSGADGPAAAIEMFKQAVAAHWPEVEFDVGGKPSGKALRLTFPGISFTFDLVPAFDTNDDYVLIGDRFERTWTPSNTRIQIAKVAERNQATGGRFVHHVREAKELTKQFKELDFIDGIVTESLAYASVTRKMSDKEAVHAILVHAKDAVRGEVIEPGGDDDVMAKWTDTQRSTAAGLYAIAARKAGEALAMERTGDTAGAISVWHSLFGDDFPAPPTRSVPAVLTALGSGSITETGWATSTRAARQSARPARSWSRPPGHPLGPQLGHPLGPQAGPPAGPGLTGPVPVTSRQTLDRPVEAAAVLEDLLYGISVERVLEGANGGVAITMSMRPLPELEAAGFPIERVRVCVWPDSGIYSFPLGPERTWRHRHPSPMGPRFGHLAGELCLWYPHDPHSLRWEWEDGLEQYVTIVYRHLLYEEQFRRTGAWPVEEAPHSRPDNGFHPIVTAFMRREARRWAA